MIKYLQLAQLSFLGRKVVQSSAALLNSDLRAIQPLLQRLGTGLEVRHLGLQVLEMQRSDREDLFSALKSKTQIDSTTMLMCAEVYSQTPVFILFGF